MLQSFLQSTLIASSFLELPWAPYFGQNKSCAEAAGKLDSVSCSRKGPTKQQQEQQSSLNLIYLHPRTKLVDCRSRRNQNQAWVTNEKVEFRLSKTFVTTRIDDTPLCRLTNTCVLDVERLQLRSTFRQTSNMLHIHP
jgi:hypothetical protein